MPSKSNRKRTADPYTIGEMNKLIDSICHPFFRDNPAIILFDGLLHAIVEQNPPLTIRKFIRYNLQKLVNKSFDLN